jgi:hypothetical protein
LASFELTPANYLYGHAKVFKNYAGLPDIYPIKVFYSHGALFDDLFLKHRNFSFDTRIPTFLAWGRNEEEMMLRCHPDIKVYVVGTPFIYADNLFSDEYVQKEKKRLGKNLLVFPAHSCKAIHIDFSQHDFIKSISRFKCHFDSIRVCIYWKDIHLNYHRIYTENGFEVVTAGNSMDCNFISRLKGLLSICDATITNGFGSHIGYSIDMNKPVLLIDIAKFNDVCLPAGLRNMINVNNMPQFYTSNKGKQIIDKLQSNEDFKLSEEMRDLIEPYWGLREKKTKEELRQIFYEAEQLFKKSRKKYTFLKYR